jgi:hypothetical protein
MQYECTYSQIGQITITHEQAQELFIVRGTFIVSIKYEKLSQRVTTYLKVGTKTHVYICELKNTIVVRSTNLISMNTLYSNK